MFKQRQMITCALVLLLAALAFTSTGYTEPNIGSKARTRISLKFTLNDGRLIKVGTFEGGKVKLKIRERAYTIIPSVQDADSSVVELAVAHGSAQRRGGDTDQIVRLRMDSEFSDETSINPDFAVQVLGIEKVFKSAKQGSLDRRSIGGLQFLPVSYHPPAGPRDTYDAGEGVCCVSCDGVTACSSCFVEVVGCGSCWGSDCPGTFFPDD